MEHPRRSILFGLLAALEPFAPWSCSPPAQRAATLVDVPVLAHCRLPRLDQPALCGSIAVPERRGRNDSRIIKLRVVVLPAEGSRPSADPIVPMPGGPGGSVIAGASRIARILKSAHQDRAILLVDPRGTGQSGSLECPLEEGSHLGGFVHDFMPPKRVSACRAALESRADLASYNTESIADDLEDVLSALRIELVNFHALSGGTRQVLVFQARHPARVRSMVLAGVVPRSFRIPLDYGRDGQRALEILARDCQADSACHRAFPNIPGDLHATLAQLAAPLWVRITAVTGAADSVVLSRGIVAEHIRTLLYTPARASGIPFILHAAAHGDFLPLIETMLPNWRPPPSDGIAMGHYLSVTCSEDLARIDSAEVPAATVGTFLGPYRVQQQIAACRLWPHATLPHEHFTPTVSAVPALLISGEADPVTPPRWAEAALEFLPNGRHVVFPHGGHVPFDTPCAVRLAAEFFASASARDLDISCVATFTRPPFRIR